MNWTPYTGVDCLPNPTEDKQVLLFKYDTHDDDFARRLPFSYCKWDLPIIDKVPQYFKIANQVSDRWETFAGWDKMPKAQNDQQSLLLVHKDGTRKIVSSFEGEWFLLYSYQQLNKDIERYLIIQDEVRSPILFTIEFRQENFDRLMSYIKESKKFAEKRLLFSQPHQKYDADQKYSEIAGARNASSFIDTRIWHLINDELKKLRDNETTTA